MSFFQINVISILRKRFKYFDGSRVVAGHCYLLLLHNIAWSWDIIYDPFSGSFILLTYNTTGYTILPKNQNSHKPYYFTKAKPPTVQSFKPLQLLQTTFIFTTF